MKLTTSNTARSLMSLNARIPLLSRAVLLAGNHGSIVHRTKRLTRVAPPQSFSKIPVSNRVATAFQVVGNALFEWALADELGNVSGQGDGMRPFT
jgi:hypothetical protein